MYTDKHLLLVMAGAAALCVPDSFPLPDGLSLKRPYKTLAEKKVTPDGLVGDVRAEPRPKREEGRPACR